MASLSVAAIVVSHGQAELLARSLQAVASQTHRIEQVVVVETSGNSECIELAKSFGFATITPGDVKLGAAVNAGINSLASMPGWIWLVHDDLVARDNALEEMAKAAEISPSVAIIGPKLLEIDNPIQIQQMGLTATQTGRPFLLVQQEYDQGQHDKAGDTLSVSTAGMLFSLGVWQEVGGLSDATPVLAQDWEFGAKARLAGYRVVIEANAKMLHAGLSMNGNRPRNWLGRSVRGALSRAHLHIATLMLPLPLMVLTYLLLPLMVLASVPLHLVAKQPARILGQFLGWWWAWGTLGTRISARANFRRFGSVKQLKPLLATARQVRSRRKARYEAQPEVETSSLRPGLFRSNSAWFSILPLIASIGLFPRGAIGSAGYLPLGANFQQVFAALDSAIRPYLNGLTVPQDPFAWFLLLSAAISPSNPSLGFAILGFVAPTFAFLGVWQLGKQFISKPWVITLIALAYALSPQLLATVQFSRVQELLAAAVAPWAIALVLRAFHAYNSARAWRWTGLAGLVLAVQATLSSTIFALVLLLVLILAVAKPRRLGILIWMPLPGLALLGPWLTHLAQAGSYPLMTATSAVAAAPTQLGQTDLIIIGTLAFLASASWFFGSVLQVLPIWLFSGFALAASWYQPVASSQPLVLVSMLGLLLLLGIGLARVSSRIANLTVGSVLAASVAASALFYGPLTASEVVWKSNRVMPALIEAASQTDNQVRTLVIDTSSELSAGYLWGSGNTLERVSLLEQFESRDDAFANLVAQATANVVAGNAEGLKQALSALPLDFVLVSPADPEVINAIAVIEYLQPAGQSEFGALFRVEATKAKIMAVSAENQFLNWQLGLLAAFGLLAIPTRASIRGYRRVKRGGK